MATHLSVRNKNYGMIKSKMNHNTLAITIYFFCPDMYEVGVLFRFLITFNEQFKTRISYTVLIL